MPRFRTPGPGAYDVPEWLNMSIVPSEIKASSMFKSGSRRRDLANRNAGDPGAYSGKATMGERAQQSHNRNVRAGNAGFNSSSPARPRSAPPSRSRGGPGEHDYAHLFSMGSPHASPQMTSSFKSAVPFGGHVRQPTTPPAVGVGAYDITDGPCSTTMGNSQDARSLSKEGQSMFAGTVARKGLADTRRTEAHVGPGTYKPGGSIQDGLEERINPRLPGFNSSLPRSISAGRLSRGPSPGSYDGFRETLSARSARSHNTLASSGRSRFLSSSERKSLVNDELGDPGANFADSDAPAVHRGKSETLSARSRRSFNRDVNRGSGSFNSSSHARARTPPPGSARGGPGEHDYAHLFECGSKHVSTQMTSSFSSALPLGGHVRKPTTPPAVGVGAYDITDGPCSTTMGNSQDARSLSKEGQSMFAGTVARKGLADTRRTEAHVGPGAYDLSRTSIRGRMEEKVNPRLPGFNSSAPRSPED
jgi:hypothetical protein